jgi:hypothetical protein
MRELGEPVLHRDPDADRERDLQRLGQAGEAGIGGDDEIPPVRQSWLAQRSQARDADSF